MANDGQKKSMVLKALDTVERVGNRLPDFPDSDGNCHPCVRPVRIPGIVCHI